MYTRTLLITLLAALFGTGAVLGAARSPAAPATASNVAASDTSTPIETSRLALALPEWLAKLGVMPQARASALEATLRLPALSVLDEASNLSGSISRWFSANGAAPDLDPPRQSVVGRRAPGR